MNMQSAALLFADALSRERKLTDAESDVLYGVAASSCPRRLWTAADNRQLARLARTKRAPQIAEETGRGVWAVRKQLQRLRMKDRG